MSLAQLQQDRANRAWRRHALHLAELAVQPCGQCEHARGAHHPYHEPGDPEAWSWCDECGGRCEFVEDSGVPDPPFAIAPLGDAWTVVTPDASWRIAPPQPWDLTMAVLARVGLNAMPEIAGRFTWVAC